MVGLELARELEGVHDVVPRERALTSDDATHRRAQAKVAANAASGKMRTKGPDEEIDTLGTNVLALAPRRCLVVEGNPVTRKRLESAGVEVISYRGTEISWKGCGGPTCLTRPLLRD